MAENTVLFQVDVDESGAVRGFQISREELEKLRTRTDQVGRSSDKAAAGSKRFGDATERTGRQARQTSDTMRRLKQVVATVFTVATVRQALQYADTIKNLDARLRIVTDSEESFARAREETRRISEETFSTLEATTELYARLELSLRGQEVSQNDVLKVTKALNQAYHVSGSTQQEATASVIQLSQGLAAGALRGDEFRSVMEQAPRVVQALTDSLGLTRGELRELANDGKLTTDVIVAAMLEQAEAIEEQTGNLELTVARAWTNLRTDVIEYVGELDEATDASKTVAEAIKDLGENLDTVANVGLAAMSAGVIVLIPRLYALGVAFTASLGPLGLLATAVGLASFKYLQARDDQDEMGRSARDLAAAINEATTALEFQNTVLEAHEAIASRRERIGALEGQIGTQLDTAEQFQGSRPDLAAGPEAAAISAQREIQILTDEIAKYQEVLDQAKAARAGLTAEEKKAVPSARELLELGSANTDALKAQKEAEKDYAEALGAARSLIEEFGTEQEQLTLVRELHVETLERLRKGLKGVAGAETLLASAERILGAQVLQTTQAIKDEFNPVTQLSEAMRLLRREIIDTNEEGFLQLELMLEAVEIKFGAGSAEAEAMRERIRQLRLEMEELRDVGDDVRFQFVDATAYGFFRDLRQELLEASQDAGKTIADAFAESIKENPLGFANALFGAVANFQQLKDSGLTGLDALNKTIAAADIPIVSEVAQVLDAINQVFGGSLFGTKFATNESRRNIDISGAGATGGVEIDQSKKKSFFRGTKRRTLFEGLDPETQDAISELFQAALDALTGAVEALGVTAPDFVAGKFIETFDADGNLTSSISEFFGRTFSESFEEFGKRLIAENILAGVAQAVGDVEVTQTTVRSPAEAFGLGPRDVADFGPGLGDIPDIIRETTVMMNEAQAIAERWRHDAELLLEGAQFLLVAQSAIQEGEGLFDSLTQTVDVIEELGNAGEGLIETYVRVVSSVQTLEEALDLLDQSLDLGREEFVRFAEEFTDAAGGVNDAATLWQRYFDNFFDADELLAARLRVARTTSEAELSDVGLGPGVTRDEFRAIFESVLPSLSAEALAEWLEAADALATVLDLEQELADLRVDTLQDLRDAFDFVAASIDDILGSTITALRRELLSPEELHDELRGEALGLADQIGTAGSREEVLALIRDLDQVTRDTRSAAGDTRFNQDLIEFLEQAREAAGIRLDELRAEAIAEAELQLREIESREGFTEATSIFAGSVETFRDLLANNGQIITPGGEGTQAIAEAIREGLNPELMAATLNNLAGAVVQLSNVTQFQLENPPTLIIEQPAANSGVGLV